MNMTDLLPCVECGKMGYADERTSNAFGSLCSRCAHPLIDFSQVYGLNGVVKNES
jgi:hypothetical protein